MCLVGTARLVSLAVTALQKLPDKVSEHQAATTRLQSELDALQAYQSIWKKVTELEAKEVPAAEQK